MQPLDYLVIGLYAVGMLAIGHFYKQKVQSGDDYLLGGRTMSPFMVGVSLFATLTSTLSYLAYPGEMIKNGPMIFASLFALPLVLYIVGWILIPRIMSQDVTSGYELLERRLGLEGRLTGAGLFMVLRTLWMAAILFATSSKVLVPLLGIEERWTPVVSVLLGLITIIYSSQGGMRAVVMTDAIQSLIMLVGAVVAIVAITRSLGGVGAWWPAAWATHWQKPVFWFSGSERVTFMGATLNYLIWFTCTAGSDQMAIQRYLSTRDASAARRSFGFSLVTEVIQTVLLGLVGLALMGYFLAHSELLGANSVASSADELFAKFVVDVLPAGVSGLLIAAMLSAAMSSLSSGMNSASAVITSDFVGRLGRQSLSPEANVRVARLSSIAVGTTAVLLSVLLGILIPRIPDFNLMELCYRVVNLLTAPLFVLFFLALFVGWARPLGGVAAAISSVAVAIGIVFFKWWGLGFLWATPVSFVVGVVVGGFVSLLVPEAPLLRPRDRS
ncbi:MAG: sodium-coupled permease [Planctomycetota bacterium]|nr:sodium-coupled permease [Planctomycetota bacterium]